MRGPLVPDGDFRTMTSLRDHQQELWQGQRRYVAAGSAFFRDLWDGQAPPTDLEQLSELPLSDKAMLRRSQADHPPFGDYLTAPRRAAVRLHRTSGTTGQAMNLALSAADRHVTQIVGGRAQKSAGLGADDTVVHCLNYQMWMGGLTDHMTLEETGALVIPFGVGSTDLLIRTILDVGVTAISCTPSYPAVLEKVLMEKFPGIAPGDLGLRLGLFGGEPGLDDPAFRQRLRDVWGMEPRNANYGVSDVFCNFAAQCEHDTRLHFLAADVLWPELINPETGAALDIRDGVEGELVLTHLARECQPLVRFRTGDIISVDNTAPCDCGRGGFRFRVIGRSDDMVVVRGLNMFPTMVGVLVGQFAGLTGDYRIVLSAPPPHDVLPVQIELARDVSAERMPGLAQEIEQAFKSRLGVSAQVQLRPFGSFPLTEGKTQRVIRKYS